MGRGRHLGSQSPGGLDDSSGQGSSLYRVCPRSQLVKENQALVIRLLQDAHDIHHVGGEGGQGLGDGLLIPDIGQHTGDDPYGRVIFCRDMEATLGHQGDQAQGLQGNRLSSGVWAGDNQGIESLPQFQVVGHRLLLVQEGVPCSPQAQILVRQPGFSTLQF